MQIPKAFSNQKIDRHVHFIWDVLYAFAFCFVLTLEQKTLKSCFVEKQGKEMVTFGSEVCRWKSRYTEEWWGASETRLHKENGVGSPL